jgi:enoyl-CoA hydratase/carnithine racemase
MPQVIGGLQNLDIPTIAMVNGPAYGQGFGMALACDMRVGSDQAKCCVAWTRRGVMPACGEQWTLPRIVGLGRAFEIIFTGREVGAEEAERIGILNKLVPAAKLQEETMELARALAKGPAVAYRLGKMALYKATAGMDMMDTLDFTSAAQAVAFTTEDYWESAKAFEEKREPVFRGR